MAEPKERLPRFPIPPMPKGAKLGKGKKSQARIKFTAPNLPGQPAPGGGYGEVGGYGGGYGE